MEALYCYTCQLSSSWKVISTVSCLAAKVFGVSSAAILAFVSGLSLLYFMIRRRGQQAASLEDYPAASAIRELLQSRHGGSNIADRVPLHTEGRHVVDKNGERLKLLSINWYGASDQYMIPGGLDVQHRSMIAQSICKLGFNSVRLPYADEMVYRNPIVAGALLAANPDLVGRDALSVFHAVVESLADAGLGVIINNHITQARWCCDGNLCDAKWENSYLGRFCKVHQTEEDWISNLEAVMRPLRSNPLVIGVDLRNEVRGPSGRWLWGSWAAAAERASGRLHALQPEWLMIVEGIASANDISGAVDRPVQLSVPRKLVYSAHVYGWSGWGSLKPYWYRKYHSFAQDMLHNWTFLLEDDIAPVWIGEFGAPAVPNEGDLHYWKNLMRYLREVDADIGYWALNPRKPKDNEVESYGLLSDDWATPVYDYRLYDLAQLMSDRTDQDVRKI